MADSAPKPTRWLPAHLPIVAGAVLVAVTVAALWIDIPYATWARQNESAGWWGFDMLAYIGNGMGWTILVLALWVGFGLFKHKAIADGCAIIFVSLLASGLVNSLLKMTFGRYRPKAYFDEQGYGFLFFEYGYVVNSFPSGHATAMGALMMSIWLVGPRWIRPIAVVGTVIVALGRAGETAHWISDVIAGYFGGACIAYLVYRLLWPRLQRLGAKPGPVTDPVQDAS